MFSLSGKVALITGAGQGIGRGIAEVFAQAGAKIVVAERNAETGTAVVEALQAKGHAAQFEQCDVGSRSDIVGMVERAGNRNGRLDIVVHNAGHFPFVSISELTEAQMEMTLAVNLKAAFYLTQAAVPYMIRQKRGRILCTSSVTGPRVATPLLAHYAAAKAGVNGFIKAAALEYARLGITVNGVEPGFIRTQAIEKFASEKELVEMCHLLPLGDLGSPEDIAYAMLYLASDEASYVTGQTIVVDGGATAPESQVLLPGFYAAQKDQLAADLA